MMDEKSNHVGLEQLADYAEQRLAAADVAQVAGHLSACSYCQAELRWVLSTTVALVPDTWQSPPLVARAKVRRAFREGQRQQQPWLDFVALWRRALNALGARLAGQPFRPALVVAATVLVLVITFVSLFGRQSVAPGQAVVTSLIRGDVQFRAAESESWQPVALQVGSPRQPFYLYTGDQVLTGANSSLQLAFFDNSITLLDEATELTVRQIERRDGEYGVSLFQRRGRTEVSVQPAPGDAIDFQIETPLALVRVTGTQFVVSVGEDGTTEVAVHDGTVVVSTESASIEVHAGEVVVVEPGGPPATREPTATPAKPAPTDVSPAAPPSDRSPAADKVTKEVPEALPQADHTPGTRQDGDRGNPTRKPMPEQAQPHPTKKPLPTQVPPPAQGSPPGQEKRPNLDKLPDRPVQRP